jgi:lysine-N-methylase
MALPVRSLPVIQNWDCQGCSDCCRQYLVHVTPEEQARIENQGWHNRPEFAKVKLFRRLGNWFRRKGTVLNHREGGACVFLDENNRCRIHGEFGSAAKPLACRVYPFMLIPAGSHWQVGLRFACPSSVQDTGKPLNEHLPDVRQYALELESREDGLQAKMSAAPQLQFAQTISWPDIQIFVREIRTILDSTDQPLEWRLRKILTLADLCRQAKFNKISGNRLAEFLETVSKGVEDDLLDGEELAPPGWIGRMLFRQSLALWIRKDSGSQQGISKKGRIALLWSASKMARGTGKVPKLHRQIPDVTFQAIEEETKTGLSEFCDDLLTRYYLVKVESLQFFGPTNFKRNFWDGLETLISTFPAIGWLTRALSIDRTDEEASHLALQIVDDNFGFNPLLGSARQMWAIRLLVKQGEMGRLIARYA